MSNKKRRPFEIEESVCLRKETDAYDYSEVTYFEVKIKHGNNYRLLFSFMPEQAIWKFKLRSLR